MIARSKLLREAHVLARTYGWSEPDIFRLSLRRRRAYLRAIEDDLHAAMLAEAGGDLR
jgi:hypothetical protein